MVAHQDVPRRNILHHRHNGALTLLVLVVPIMKNSSPLISSVVSFDECPTETLLELMPLDEADKILHSSPPLKPKNLSAYKRFKVLFASPYIGSTLPSTEVINKEWDAIKAIDVEAVPFEDRTKAMELKRLAELQCMEEGTKHQASLAEWCSSFDQAAMSILTYLSVEASESNFLPLQNTISRIVHISENFWSPSIERKHLGHLHRAQSKIKLIKTAYEPQLFFYLRHVSDHDLVLHCRKFANLQTTYRTLRTEHEETLRELDVLAKGIPHEIISNMEKQLRPISGQFPQEGIPIEYIRHGVSQTVFHLAFNGPHHAKSFLIKASCVGQRRNKKFALICSDIQVCHDQNKLTATAVYHLKSY